MAKPSKNMLSGLVVSQAMRRQVIQLSRETSIGASINTLIKYKINALLTTDQKGRPLGVLSKTDIMGAYYAGLPIESPVEDIMSRPPLFCHPEDGLEKALQLMHSKGIYRLYVTDAENNNVVGALAYPDIVGLLYKYCHECEYSRFRRKSKKQADPIKRFFIKEIMTKEVKSVFKDDPLFHVMEELSMFRFGAILVRDRNQKPCGVISKTDLALAYKHSVDPKAPAETIMSSPVQTCNGNDLLEDAIRKMIFSDLRRLFVYMDKPDEFSGVISLSDTARLRSGSCHACISSRIKLET